MENALNRLWAKLRRELIAWSITDDMRRKNIRRWAYRAAKADVDLSLPSILLLGMASRREAEERAWKIAGRVVGIR